MNNAWCCCTTAYGQPCAIPAEFAVYYGSAPDEVTLMCEGHLGEEWQPTWDVRVLDDESRRRWSLPWSEWLACDAS